MSLSKEFDDIIKYQEDNIKQALINIKEKLETENIEPNTYIEIFSHELLKQMKENNTYDKKSIRDILDLYIEVFGDEMVLDLIIDFLPTEQYMDCLLDMTKEHNISYCDFYVD